MAGITHLLGYLHERQRKAAVGGLDVRLERGCSLLGRISEDGNRQLTDFDLSTYGTNYSSPEEKIGMTPPVPKCQCQTTCAGHVMLGG